MRHRSLGLAVPLAAMALLPLPLVAHAEEPAAPPPSWPAERSLAPEQEFVLPLRREAPAAVKEALASLATACAAWPKPASPSSDRVPSPLDVNALPEHQACEMLVEPGRAFTFVLWFCGVLGGVVTIAGLVGFCFLRMVLVQMWAWRPRAAALPWR